MLTNTNTLTYSHARTHTHASRLAQSNTIVRNEIKTKGKTSMLAFFLLVLSMYDHTQVAYRPILYTNLLSGWRALSYGTYINKGNHNTQYHH